MSAQTHRADLPPYALGIERGNFSACNNLASCDNGADMWASSVKQNASGCAAIATKEMACR